MCAFREKKRWRIQKRVKIYLRWNCIDQRTWEVFSVSVLGGNDDS